MPRERTWWSAHFRVGTRVYVRVRLPRRLWVVGYIPRHESAAMRVYRREMPLHRILVRVPHGLVRSFYAWNVWATEPSERLPRYSYADAPRGQRAPRMTIDPPHFVATDEETDPSIKPGRSIKSVSGKYEPTSPSEAPWMPGK